MIHRPFLVKSFRDPLYAYTRITCLSAALTILKEYERIASTDVASIWVVPAFTISAAIIVVLDLLHKVNLEDADHERRRLVQAAVEFLDRDHNNFMAIRGVKLVRMLLERELELRKRSSPSSRALSEVHNATDVVSDPNVIGTGQNEPAAAEMEAWFTDSIPYFAGTGYDASTFGSLEYDFAYS